MDMDASYAAIETLCDPSLKGKPVVVGSMSMISKASYEAWKFGVPSTMFGFIACKLCPKLLFVPVDFLKYNHYNNLTRKVFQQYDPNFLAASLDEAYLDITIVCKDWHYEWRMAEELRQSVHLETGLTCSAGVAPNRFLAKENIFRNEWKAFRRKVALKSRLSEEQRGMHLQVHDTKALWKLTAFPFCKGVDEHNSPFVCKLQLT